MLPLLLGAAALLLLGKSSSKKPPKLPGQPLRVVMPGGQITTATKPSNPPLSYDVEIGPVKILRQGPALAADPGMGPELSKEPSQGGSPPLAPPLSADIPTDSLPAAPQSSAPPRSPNIPGYNPTAARRGSSALSTHLKRTGKAGYDRRLVKTWQTQAGLAPDGLYGPATRGALIFYGQKDPPPAFAGSGTTTFRPPPS